MPLSKDADSTLSHSPTRSSLTISPNVSLAIQRPLVQMVNEAFVSNVTYVES